MNPKRYPALKSLSQNFLRSPAVARSIVDKLPLSPEDRVVELGAGQGAITFLLSERAARVLAVEIDAGHYAQLQERIAQSGRTNILLRHEDILKADWQEWFEILEGPFTVVGNLPYHISSPILFKMVENRNLLRGAYVMLQKEVADRLLGQPGQKEYGVLTVLIGYQARVRPLLQLGPGAFFPRPKVASTFVEIRFIPEPAPAVEDESLFHWLVRAAFGQRRKQLKNALTADSRFPAEGIQQALDRNGIDPRSRGETLSISQFVALSNTLVQLKKELNLP